MSEKLKRREQHMKNKVNEKQILSVLNNIAPAKRVDIDKTQPVCHSNTVGGQQCYYPEYYRLYSDYHAYFHPYRCYPVYTLMDNEII